MKGGEGGRNDVLVILYQVVQFLRLLVSLYRQNVNTEYLHEYCLYSVCKVG